MNYYKKLRVDIPDSPARTPEPSPAKPPDVRVVDLVGNREMTYDRGMSTIYADTGESMIIKVSNPHRLVRHLRPRGIQERARVRSLLRRDQTRILEKIRRVACPLLGACLWVTPARLSAAGKNDIVCVHASERLEPLRLPITPKRVAEAIVGLRVLRSHGMRHNDSVVRNLMERVAPEDFRVPVQIRKERYNMVVRAGQRHSVWIDFNMSTRIEGAGGAGTVLAEEKVTVTEDTTVLHVKSGIESNAAPAFSGGDVYGDFSLQGGVSSDDETMFIRNVWLEHGIPPPRDTDAFLRSMLSLERIRR